MSIISELQSSRYFLHVHKTRPCYNAILINVVPEVQNGTAVATMEPMAWTNEIVAKLRTLRGSLQSKFPAHWRRIRILPFEDRSTLVPILDECYKDIFDGRWGQLLAQQETILRTNQSFPPQVYGTQDHDHTSYSAQSQLQSVNFVPGNTYTRPTNPIAAGSLGSLSPQFNRTQGQAYTSHPHQIQRGIGNPASGNTVGQTSLTPAQYQWSSPPQLDGTQDQPYTSTSYSYLNPMGVSNLPSGNTLAYQPNVAPSAGSRRIGNERNVNTAPRVGRGNAPISFDRQGGVSLQRGQTLDPSSGLQEGFDAFTPLASSEGVSHPHREHDDSRSLTMPTIGQAPSLEQSALPVVSAGTDLLPNCTTQAKLDRNRVIKLSDIAGSLREVAFLAVGEYKNGEGRDVLDGAVGKECADGIREFWGDEWVVGL